jgi:cell division protein FtsI/penicillin-binding protein 2
MIKAVQYRRLVLMMVLLMIAFVTLGYRLVDLQVRHHEDLRKEVEEKTHKTILREPRRGDILDRRGNRLAGSIFVKSVCVDPSLIGTHQAAVAQVLAPLLEMDYETVFEKLQPRSYINAKGEVKIDQYVHLKRQVAIETWEAIQKAMSQLSFGVDEKKVTYKERSAYDSIRKRAVFTEAYDEQKRIYPNRGLAAHVLGFVGRSDRDTVLGRVTETAGADGMERVLDSVLSGVPGWRSTEVARRGELAAFRDQDVEPHDGNHVVLSIDIGLQHIVETELAEVMQRHSPLSASAIVVRPRTGEILALANAPTFDPNDPGAAPADSRRNRALTDFFEPGSTFKIVAISAALNDGLVTPQTLIDCEHGRFFFANRSLKDDHPAGIITVEEVVTKSSNIGTAKIAIQMGPERLAHYIRQFGFGTPTGVQLLGEASGMGHSPKGWTKISVSRIPIGQGIAVTPIQMIMAMSAVANGGRLMQPMLVSRVVDEKGTVVIENHPREIRQVISETTAKQMVAALKTVVSTNGTARRAKLDYYTVAGKTGTAQKPGKGGYAPGKYFASFIGFFPADEPELCISVVLDEPKLLSYYGGHTAAPAFRNIAERAAKYLAIKPDLIPSEPQVANQGNKSNRALIIAKQRPN